jgi:hypothetical protein
VVRAGIIVVESVPEYLRVKNLDVEGVNFLK